MGFFDQAVRFAAQEHLPAERGPVELPGGQPHWGILGLSSGFRQVRGARDLAWNSGRVPIPLETVEDQIEAVLEFVAVVVAGLHGVLGDELDEVRVLVHGERLEHALRHLGDLLRGIERQVHLRQSEAVDVAIKERVGVGGHLDVEACGAKPADRYIRMNITREGPAACENVCAPSIVLVRRAGNPDACRPKVISVLGERHA